MSILKLGNNINYYFEMTQNKTCFKLKKSLIE